MGRRSIRRFVLKWVLLVVCILIAAIWGLSLYYSVGTPLSHRAFIFVTFGDLHCGMTDRTLEWYPKPWMEGHPFDGLFGQVWPRGYSTSRYRATKIIFPIWLLFVTAGLATAALFYRDRSAESGCCRVCGYDLRASSEKCSECGTIILPTSSPVAIDQIAKPKRRA